MLSKIFIIIPTILLLSSCVTPILQVLVPDAIIQQRPSTQEPTVEPPPSFADMIRDQHYVGWFNNDRTRQSYPAILQLAPHQTDSQSTSAIQMHAVLRIFTANDMPLSAFYADVSLRTGKRSDDQLLFPQATRQKIKVVGAGQLGDDGQAQLFAVVYGFGQGMINLHRQAVSSYALPTTSAYPQASAQIDGGYTQFPQQAFVQQQLPAVNTKLLEDSKNLLANDLFGFNHELRTRLGVYYGVLHHEYHNRFQYVRLAFTGDKSGKNNMLTTANTLFFSLPNKREFVVYRYSNQLQDDDALPTILAGEGDNFLKIKQWDRDKIEALWYSKVHGRIGNVYLQRDSFPQLPKQAQIVSALAGSYANADYACEVKIDNKIANDASLYPSTVHGNVRDIKTRKNHLINAGRYDFYRGNVELLYGGKRMRYSLQQGEFAPTVEDVEIGGSASSYAKSF
ncbi:MAG: hypothetical protein OYH77_08155 [Pseudomonadota bacterium]|nr:hypothetical protein [Pseudomonadota bacterium]